MSSLWQAGNNPLLSQCDRQSQEIVFITLHVSKDDNPLEGKITLVAWSKKGGIEKAFWDGTHFFLSRHLLGPGR